MKSQTHLLKVCLWLGLLICLQIPSLIGIAADSDKADRKEANKGAPVAIAETEHAYLGVLVEDLPPAMASHLPDLAGTGQGVLVLGVLPDSPAAKAGLKEHDVLLTYDDQKLYVREQLSRLILNDRSGREVAIRLIREGKSETVKVSLGNRAAYPGVIPIPDDAFSRRPPRMGLLRPGRRGPAGKPPVDQAHSAWHQINSIEIKRLDKNRFHALLTHFDKDGKLEKHEYEGTRDELAKLIDADDDLKHNERTHLLRGLGIPDHNSPWELFPDESGHSF